MAKLLYQVRCRIIDVDGIQQGRFVLKTPDESRPHIGKLGTAFKEDWTVKITLDDGTILYGYECWWEPVNA